MKDKTNNRVIIFLFYLTFLGSVLYSRQFIGEVFSRNNELLKLSKEGRNIYIEDKYYHGRSCYEYYLWLDQLIPKNYTFNIYNKNNYLYYHTRMNYYLYPRYIPINENIELEANYGKMDFMDRLPYKGLVFAISLRPSLSTSSKGGIYFTYLKGNKYYLVAECGQNNYLLIQGSFLKDEVLNEPNKWAKIIAGFHALYPGKNINLIVRGE